MVSDLKGILILEYKVVVLSEWDGLKWDEDGRFGLLVGK